MEVMPPEPLLPARPSAASSPPSAASSPEFEFWKVRNPSGSQPTLLSADELFVDGIILPLHLLNPHPAAEPTSTNPPDPPPPPPKRWKDMFRGAGEEKEKRRRNRKSSVGGAAELNINIWPFSRSRSAGNNAATGASRQKGRSVSSAPCSRSNSRGESSKVGVGVAAGGRAPAARGGGGVHVGRSKSNPIWQVRRAKKIPPASTATAEVKEGGDEDGGGGVGGGAKKVNGSGSAGIRVLNLNVNSCIGYGKQQESEDRFGGEDREKITDGEQIPPAGEVRDACGRAGAGNAVNGGSNFKLKALALFSKKAH